MYLFIWLHQGTAAACELFDLHWGMGDSSLRIEGQGESWFRLYIHSFICSLICTISL